MFSELWIKQRLFGPNHWYQCRTFQVEINAYGTKKVLISCHAGWRSGGKLRHVRPILDAVLCWGVPQLFHIARLRSTYKPFFRSARTSRPERLWKACCKPQHGFSMASKMKRRSVNVIFLCKFEKYFPVNWCIIIYPETLHQISKNTESLCNIKKVLPLKGNWKIDLK